MTAALAEIAASIDAAWQEAFGDLSPGEQREAARAIVEHPDRHEWRIVDAALERLECSNCGSQLGGGPSGCSTCDLADGYRFGARETDRPEVPPGNEHAIRVSAAVLRSPGRYPAWSVRWNGLFLPLFLDGQMPTRRQQEELLAASRHGLPPDAELEPARTFGELVAIARGGDGRERLGRASRRAR